MTEIPTAFPDDDELREQWLGPTRSAFFAGLLVAWTIAIFLLGDASRWLLYVAGLAVAALVTFALLARARQRTKPL